MNTNHVLTPLEIAFNRLFAVLLVLSSLPLLLNIFTLPTIIIFVVFVFFLWFGKKYQRLRDRTRNVNTAIGGDLADIYTRQSLTFIDRYNMAGNFTSKFDPSSRMFELPKGHR